VAYVQGDFNEARNRYRAAVRIEKRLELQPQLTESLAGLCEVVAAEDGRSFESWYQRLIDSAQEWGLEDRAARGGLRCGRWFLHRGQLNDAADVLAPAITLALLYQPSPDADAFDEFNGALLEAALYWLAHQPSHRDAFVPLLSKSLRQLHRRIAPALGTYLALAVDTAQDMELEAIRTDWLRRENVRRSTMTEI
jgi:hypothetical protein